MVPFEHLLHRPGKLPAIGSRESVAPQLALHRIATDQIAQKNATEAGAGRYEKPAPDARAAPPEGSRVAHQPEDRCGGAIDRTILRARVSRRRARCVGGIATPVGGHAHPPGSESGHCVERLFLRRFAQYHSVMNDDLANRVVPASTHRWGLLEKRFGTRVRASDTAWATTLSPADRLAIVEELFGVVYKAHEHAGDWSAVDELAWRETLAERRRLTAAFHRLDEVQRGCTRLADAG